MANQTLREGMTVKREDAANDKLLGFTLLGSKTVPDGSGRSDARFASSSSRVVIEANDWNASYALSLGGVKPVPDQFTVKWKVESNSADEFVSPSADGKTETLLRRAGGLPNAKHTLEINGTDATPITAIRVHRPPLAAQPGK